MPKPTIADVLNAGVHPTFSFEFFPPKDDEALEALNRTIAALDPLAPDWVSITYGATGSNRDRTFAATQFIRDHSAARAMGHLTIAGQTEEEIRAAITSYASLDVHHILAVRGDPPAGLSARFTPHPGGLANATELVKLIKSMGDFTVGVAAFPHGHPDQCDLDLDARILLDKQEAGAEFAITQLFFDVEAYRSLVERFRAIGGTMPIVPGIMPITVPSQIERFGQMAGAPMPQAWVKPLQERAHDRSSFRALGIDLITEFCADLIAAGAPGLQFFTLNRSKATVEILAKLRSHPRHRR